MISGNDVYINKHTNIKRKHLVIMGNHIAIDYGFHCTTGMVLGDYVHISSHVSCIGGNDGRFVAKGFNNIMSGARIICGSDRFDDSGLFGALIPKELLGKQIIKPVIMEEFSNIGTNAVVLPGSRLRKGVLLTAGSVLIGATEEWGVYKGNPAKLIKKIDGSKIIEKAKRIGYKEFHLDGCFSDENKKFVFIHIFKNASIAVRNALGMRGNYFDWEEAKTFKDSTTICVIREPVQRFISAYQYILKLKEDGFPDRHPTHITRETEFYKQKNDAIKSFTMFLEFIENNGFYDAIACPQTTFLRERCLNINDIDVVMLQENLYDDFCKFKNEHNLSLELTKDNTSNREKTTELNNFVNNNKDIKNRIKQLYKADTELYDFLYTKALEAR